MTDDSQTLSCLVCHPCDVSMWFVAVLLLILFWGVFKKLSRLLLLVVDLPRSPGWGFGFVSELIGMLKQIHLRKSVIPCCGSQEVRRDR